MNGHCPIGLEGSLWETEPGLRPALTSLTFLRSATMFIISNFLVAIGKILDIALNLYMWIIVARAVISWVNPDPFNPIVRFLNAVTEPVLYQVRRRIPLFFGGIDFTPILIILVIYFLKSFLVKSLIEVAARLG